MGTEKFELKVINWLRFPLIIGVVFLHSTPGYILGPDYKLGVLFPLNVESIFIATKILMLEIFPKFAVPSFFFISGFLFFYNVEQYNISTYFYKLKRRVKSLLIPYLIWNIIAISYPLSLCVFRNIPLSNAPLDWLMYFWDADDIYNLPLNYPLWYVRDLMVISVLSPLCWFLLKRFNWWFIVLLGILYILNLIPHVMTGLGKHVILFFNLGAFFSIHRLDFLTYFRKIEKVSYFITAILIVIGLFSFGKYNDIFKYTLPLYTIFSLISIFNIASHIVEKLSDSQFSLSDYLQKRVFFIYATHTLVFIIIFDIIAFYIGNKLSSDLLSYTLFWILPFIKISICILLYNLLLKITPNALKFITGR